MLAVRLFEFFAILAVIYFLISQVVIPSIRGTVLLPFFRRSAVAREKALRHQLEEVAQMEVEKELSSEIKSRTQALKGKSNHG